MIQEGCVGTRDTSWVWEGWCFGVAGGVKLPSNPSGQHQFDLALAQRQNKQLSPGPFSLFLLSILSLSLGKSRELSPFNDSSATAGVFVKSLM